MGLREQRFIIIDTETTGADTNVDRPIEVAAVEWRNGRPGDLKSWLLDPEMFIHPGASAVHGLSDADVKGKETLAEILPELHEFVGKDPLVAHNAPFDMAMLPSFAQHDWIDSLRLARHTWILGTKNKNGHELGSHKQQEIRYWLNLQIDTQGLMAHRAAADILVTGELLQLAMDHYLSQNGEDSLKGLMNHSESPVQWPRMPWGKYKGKEFSELPSSMISYQLKLANDGDTVDRDLIEILRNEQARRIAEEHSGGAHTQSGAFFRRRPGL